SPTDARSRLIAPVQGAVKPVGDPRPRPAPRRPREGPSITLLGDSRRHEVPAFRRRGDERTQANGGGCVRRRSGSCCQHARARPARASTGPAAIGATMSGPATASVGQTVVYGVQVINGGPDAATGIGFTATLSGPGQYTLNIVQPTAKCRIRGSTISCDVGGI